jgi:DNA-directed RNA polymerase subunit RPC12/RpoP
MIVFSCHICRTALSAESTQVGQLVRCPACKTTLRVPAPQGVAVGTGDGAAPASPQISANISSAAAMATSRGSGRRFGFNCGYCSSRLEATEAMAAQEGQCPTCGNQITIPILDRLGRLIDPKTRQIIKQDPHPVHAYAAAGDRAPKITRDSQNRQWIICPRCSASSPITSNNCKSCGMPFTMEGTTIDASGAANGFCVASLVLGIIGLPICLFVPSALAIIFGVIGLRQIAQSQGSTSGKGMGIAGIVLGSVGLLIAAHNFL